VFCVRHESQGKEEKTESCNVEEARFGTCVHATSDISRCWNVFRSVIWPYSRGQTRANVFNFSTPLISLEHSQEAQVQQPKWRRRLLAAGLVGSALPCFWRFSHVVKFSGFSRFHVLHSFTPCAILHVQNVSFGSTM
jgi:hypothetical protein